MTGIVARLAFRVPVIGWLARDAAYGASDAKYFFAGNIVALLVLAVYFFGYPALIIFALSATFMIMAGLIALTASDLFAGSGQNTPEKQSDKRSQLSPRDQQKV